MEFEVERVREEVHLGHACDFVEVDIDVAEIALVPVDVADQADEGALALIAAREPGFDPGFGQGRHGIAGAEAHDDHVGFGGGFGGLVAEGGVAEQIEAPPSALEIVVVEEVLGEVIVELHRLVAGFGVFVGNHKIKGVLRFPGGSFWERVDGAFVHAIRRTGLVGWV